MQVPILFNLSDHQLLDLAQQLTPKAVNAGEVVIKEGDEGDSFYIIEEGTFSCYLNDGTKLALIDRGSCFGELALLHNDKRKCNVAAEETGGAMQPTERLPALHRSLSVALNPSAKRSAAGLCLNQQPLQGLLALFLLAGCLGHRNDCPDPRNAPRVLLERSRMPRRCPGRGR